MGTITISTPTSIRIQNFVPPKSRWPNHSRLRVKLSNAKNSLKTEGTITCSNDTTTTKTVYKDNWFDRIAINYMSQALQETVGIRNEESGYESLVAVSGVVFRNCDSIKQREIVMKVLLNAIPRPIIVMAIQKTSSTFKVFETYLCRIHLNLLPLARWSVR
ncbi:beta-carotene isomerase D27, chloroplastic-like protein, partial [Tanacetum coccineum]